MKKTIILSSVLVLSASILFAQSKKELTIRIDSFNIALNNQLYVTKVLNSKLDSLKKYSENLVKQNDEKMIMNKQLQLDVASLNLKIIRLKATNDSLLKIISEANCKLTKEECRDYSFIMQPPSPPLYLTFSFKENGTFHYSADRMNTATMQVLQNDNFDGEYKVLKTDSDYKYIQITYDNRVENVLISIKTQKLILLTDPRSGEAGQVISD